jgi:hypothetical protein
MQEEGCFIRNRSFGDARHPRIYSRAEILLLKNNNNDVKLLAPRRKLNNSIILNKELVSVRNI